MPPLYLIIDEDLFFIIPIIVMIKSNILISFSKPSLSTQNIDKMSSNTIILNHCITAILILLNVKD